ncbi:hypothetical protein LTR62_007003 [Meristemomyces frigidus]|uniref:JmjC domain-containing protein n=1 Tax=Meristemomyces frigidus TaxID=1508187 RepID=A0AAN7TC02_9PEZI|nr:hypothetical protein LTR62_007003 [Meristemomyces frigidus]
MHRRGHPHGFTPGANAVVDTDRRRASSPVVNAATGNPFATQHEQMRSSLPDPSPPGAFFHHPQSLGGGHLELNRLDSAVSDQQASNNQSSLRPFTPPGFPFLDAADQVASPRSAALNDMANIVVNAANTQACKPAIASGIAESVKTRQRSSVVRFGQGAITQSLAPSTSELPQEDPMRSTKKPSQTSFHLPRTLSSNGKRVGRPATSTTPRAVELRTRRELAAANKTGDSAIIKPAHTTLVHAKRVLAESKKTAVPVTPAEWQSELKSVQTPPISQSTVLVQDPPATDTRTSKARVHPSQGGETIALNDAEANLSILQSSDCRAKRGLSQTHKAKTMRAQRILDKARDTGDSALIEAARASLSSLRIPRVKRKPAEVSFGSTVEGDPSGASINHDDDDAVDGDQDQDDDETEEGQNHDAVEENQDDQIIVGVAGLLLPDIARVETTTPAKRLPECDNAQRPSKRRQISSLSTPGLSSNSASVYSVTNTSNSSPTIAALRSDASSEDDTTSLRGRHDSETGHSHADDAHEEDAITPRFPQRSSAPVADQGHGVLGGLQGHGSPIATVPCLRRSRVSLGPPEEISVPRKGIKPRSTLRQTSLTEEESREARVLARDDEDLNWTLLPLGSKERTSIFKTFLNLRWAATKRSSMLSKEAGELAKEATAPDTGIFEMQLTPDQELSRPEAKSQAVEMDTGGGDVPADASGPDAHENANDKIQVVDTGDQQHASHDLLIADSLHEQATTYRELDAPIALDHQLGSLQENDAVSPTLPRAILVSPQVGTGIITPASTPAESQAGEYSSVRHPINGRPVHAQSLRDIHKYTKPEEELDWTKSNDQDVIRKMQKIIARRKGKDPDRVPMYSRVSDINAYHYDDSQRPGSTAHELGSAKSHKQHPRTVSETRMDIDVDDALDDKDGAPGPAVDFTDGTFADGDFVASLRSVLQAKAELNGFPARQARRIDQLLAVAEPPRSGEILWLVTPEVAAEWLLPNRYFDGPMVVQGQQPCALQTIADFLSEHYDDTVEVDIQDPGTQFAPHVRAVKMRQVKDRFSQPLTAKMHPWNCLELATTRDDGLRPAFLNTSECSLLTSVKIPSSGDTAGRRGYVEGWKEVEKWTLVAQAGALTEPHQDSHGYSTFITVNQGIVGFGWLSNPTAQEKNDWARNHTSYIGGRWRYVILRKGMTVYFPAGTTHFVFRHPAAENTLCLGGHILRRSQIVRWIDVLLQQTRMPDSTNEDMSLSAPGYLHRVERYVKQALKDGTEDRWGGREGVEVFLEKKTEYEKLVKAHLKAAARK